MSSENDPKSIPKGPPSYSDSLRARQNPPVDPNLRYDASYQPRMTHARYAEIQAAKAKAAKGQPQFAGDPRQSGEIKKIVPEYGPRIQGTVEINDPTIVRCSTGESTVTVLPSHIPGIAGLVVANRKILPLYGGAITIGREAHNIIAFPKDGTVSANHAKIEFGAQGTKLTDSSSNGTFRAKVPQLRGEEGKFQLTKGAWVSVPTNSNAEIYLGGETGVKAVVREIPNNSQAIDLAIGNQWERLTEGQIATIGRNPDPNVNNRPVPSHLTQISGEHAAIVFYEGNVYIQDTSSNGTLVEIPQTIPADLQPRKGIAVSSDQPSNSLSGIGNKLRGLFARPVENPVQNAPLPINREQEIPVQPYLGATLRRDVPGLDPEIALVTPNGGSIIIEASGTGFYPQITLQDAQVFSKEAVAQLNNLYKTGVMTVEELKRTFIRITDQGSKNINDVNSKISLAMAQVVGEEVVTAVAGEAQVYVVKDNGDIRLIKQYLTVSGTTNFITIGENRAQISEHPISGDDQFLITVPGYLDKISLDQLYNRKLELLRNLAHSRRPGAASFDKSLLKNTTLSIIDLKS